MLIRRRLSGYGLLPLGLMMSACAPGNDSGTAPPANGPSLQASPATAATVAAAAPGDWRKALSKFHPAKDGCFKSTYPSTSWVEIPCTKAPFQPLIPGQGRAALGTQADTVGGTGQEWSPKVAVGSISWAEGSFPWLQGVASVSSNATPTSEAISSCPTGNFPDLYSLQLNTNYFSTPLCQGQGCMGWQQFTYSNGSGAEAKIEYWLLSYGGKNGTTCPPGWFPFTDPVFGHDCGIDSLLLSHLPNEAITSLPDVALTAVAGSSDMLTFSVGSSVYMISASSVLGLNGGGWNTAEFNVFGNSCGREAVFNPGAEIVVQTLTDDPSTAGAPTCRPGSFTGETNNLSLLGFSCCGMSGNPVPGIQFTETNLSTAAVPTCPLVTASPNWSFIDHPFDAIVTGHDIDGMPLNSCRAKFEGTQVGKLRGDLNTCDISYNGGENPISPLQTLVAAWTDEINGAVPSNALAFGSDGLGGPTLYPCRAYLNGEGYQLGKVRPGFGGCNFPYGGSEQSAPDYQVLTSSLPLIFQAVNAAPPPAGALIGGYDSDGTPLYVCEGMLSSGGTPGKTKATWNYCDVSYAGQELRASSYNVLLPGFKTTGTTFAAGTDSNGTTLGICQASYDNSEQVGKLLSNGNCNFGFDFGEVSLSSGFQKLAF
jgi:hypothetical protein